MNSRKRDRLHMVDSAADGTNNENQLMHQNHSDNFSSSSSEMSPNNSTTTSGNSTVSNGGSKSSAPPSKKRRIRGRKNNVRNACTSCKSKHIRCSDTKPCNNCVKRCQDCKVEIFLPDESGKMRKTWKVFPWQNASEGKDKSDAKSDANARSENNSPSNNSAAAGSSTVQSYSTQHPSAYVPHNATASNSVASYAAHPSAAFNGVPITAGTHHLQNPFHSVPMNHHQNYYTEDTMRALQQQYTATNHAVQQPPNGHHIPPYAFSHSHQMMAQSSHSYSHQKQPNPSSDVRKNHQSQNMHGEHQNSSIPDSSPQLTANVEPTNAFSLNSPHLPPADTAFNFSLDDLDDNNLPPPFGLLSPQADVPALSNQENNDSNKAQEPATNSLSNAEACENPTLINSLSATVEHQSTIIRSLLNHVDELTTQFYNQRVSYEKQLNRIKFIHAQSSNSFMNPFTEAYATDIPACLTSTESETHKSKLLMWNHAYMEMFEKRRTTVENSSEALFPDNWYNVGEELTQIGNGLFHVVVHTFYKKRFQIVSGSRVIRLGSDFYLVRWKFSHNANNDRLVFTSYTPVESFDDSLELNGVKYEATYSTSQPLTQEQMYRLHHREMQALENVQSPMPE